MGRVCALTILIVLLLISGCFGGSDSGISATNLPMVNGEFSTTRWKSTGLGSIQATAGTTGSLTRVMEGKGVVVDIQLSGTTPQGWTCRVIPAQISFGNGGPGQVSYKLEVDVPAGTADGNYAFDLKISDNFQLNTVQIPIVVGSALTTGLTKLTDFLFQNDESFQATVRASAGPADGFVVPINPTVNAAYLSGVLPKTGVALGPNSSEDFTLVVVPMTNATTQSFDAGISFFNNGTDYAVTSHVFRNAATDVSYVWSGVDYAIGCTTTSADSQASYTLTLDPILASPTGNYSFSVTGLPADLHVAFDHPTVAVNANGDPVTVTMTVTRIANAPAEFKFVTFQVVATHDTNPALTKTYLVILSVLNT